MNVRGQKLINWALLSPLLSDARSYRGTGRKKLSVLGTIWGPSFEEVIDFSHFQSKYVIFSHKCTFKILECHFPPGFFAGGRRGLAKKLENTLSKFRMSFTTRIFRQRPPRTSKRNKLESGKQYGN